MPPKYIPLRATGAHRDQIRAREVAAAQVSSTRIQTPNESATSSPVVNPEAPTDPEAPTARTRRSDLSPAVAARLRAMAAEEAEESSLSNGPRDQIRARHATATQVLSRPPSAANSNSNASLPLQPARSESSEASVDEVFSDLEESGWRNVRRSEIIGLEQEGQSDIGSPGSFVGRDNNGRGGRSRASAGVAAAVIGSAPVLAPSSTRGSSPPSTPPRIQDTSKGKGKGKGEATVSTRNGPLGATRPSTANENRSVSLQLIPS